MQTLGTLSQAHGQFSRLLILALMPQPAACHMTRQPLQRHLMIPLCPQEAMRQMQSPHGDGQLPQPPPAMRMRPGGKPLGSLRYAAQACLRNVRSLLGLQRIRTETMSQSRDGVAGYFLHFEHSHVGATAPFVHAFHRGVHQQNAVRGCRGVRTGAGALQGGMQRHPIVTQPPPSAAVGLHLPPAYPQAQARGRTPHNGQVVTPPVRYWDAHPVLSGP